MSFTHTSPDSNPLVELTGTPTDINTRGEQLRDLGRQMDATARALKNISDGDSQISDAVSKLRESAAQIHSDLDKAGTRYEDTGLVLIDYADALETGKTEVNALYEPILTAIETARTAAQEQQEAQRASGDLDRTWIWEEEPTEEQRTQAASDLRDANGAASSAETALEELWTDYDRYFSKWERAYDKAVTGIEDAMEAADNNDNWFDDALDVFMEVLGWVLVALTIAAFIFAPIAGAILAVIAVLTVISLLVNLYRVSKGRASWLDVGLDVVGIIPFIGPAARSLSGGGNVVRAFTTSLGSGATRAALGTTRSKLQHYMMQGVNAADRPGVIAQVDNLMRPVAGGFVQRGSSTFMNALRGGDSVTGTLLGIQRNVTSGLAGSSDLARALRVSGAADLIPGTAGQVANVVSAVLSGDQIAQVIPAYDDFRDNFSKPQAIW